MTLLIFYIVGCFIAFSLICNEFAERYPDENEVTLDIINKDYPEASVVFVFGTLGSWVTIVMWIISYMDNKFRK